MAATATDSATTATIAATIMMIIVTLVPALQRHQDVATLSDLSYPDDTLAPASST